MAYIGNTSTTQSFTPAIDYFSGNGSTTAFTLSRPVASVAQVQVVVNNVAQNPGSAFSVLGQTITFTGAPSSGTNNIYVYYTSPINQVIAPGQGTVQPASMSTGGPSWDTSGNMTLTGNLILNNGTADGAQLVLQSLGYSDWNVDNYNGSLRAYYNATEYFKVSSTGDLQFNSGYGSVATAYGCRAWVNFNGTGTVAIRASGNVSSITDNGVGDYTLNFTTSMPDANYSSVVSCQAGGAGGEPRIGAATTYSTSTCRIETGYSAFTNVDCDFISSAIFR